jgi:hypothetical protein
LLVLLALPALCAVIALAVGIYCSIRGKQLAAYYQSSPFESVVGCR